MAENRPSTPTNPSQSEETSDREVSTSDLLLTSSWCAATATDVPAPQDKFEDADDMTTPRPPIRASSPEATRSLTDRSPSNTSHHNPVVTEQRPVPLIPDQSPKEHSDTSAAHERTISQTQDRISVGSMDDVNLGEGA